MPSRAKRWLIVALACALVATSLVGWALYQRQRTVLLDINGLRVRYHTREPNTQGIINALGLDADLGDAYALTPRQDLKRGQALAIHVARPVYLLADGEVQTIVVSNTSLGQALQEAGLAVGPDDLLSSAGQPAKATAPLPLPDVPARAQCPRDHHGAASADADCLAPSLAGHCA